MFLLDTNVVSELRPGKKGRPSAAVRTWAGGVPIEHQFLSVMTLYELDVGTLAMERRDPAQGAALRAWFDALRALFASRTLPVTSEVAARCARLQVPARLPEVDALIAATALTHRMTVVTRNVQDFARTGVQLLNPWGD